ncbi:MAG TPA: DUF423 domain-containing protein [Polyangiaceae bacterium]|nr:DUF423 domain-containing protein [Polyangiaceae bacterium]
MTELPLENRRWLTVSALLGASAVGLGAWGSHGLRHSVSPELLSVWRTGVEYQMFHTLAALAIAVGARRLERWRWTLRLWVLGIGLFSGSLYVLVLSEWRLLGVITPFGGLSLISGWLGLVFAARNRISANP